MRFWNYILLEGFCLYETSKDKWTKVTSDNIFDPRVKPRWKTVKNPSYINAKRPKWCKRLNPSVKCLQKDCPFFAWAPAYQDAYRAATKGITRWEQPKENNRHYRRVKNAKEKIRQTPSR